jgi:hypothetical protein
MLCFPLVTSTADHNESSPELGDTVIGRIENLEVRGVVHRFELLYKAIENGGVSSSRHARHVLHYEVSRLQSRHNPKEIEDEAISRVVYQSLSNCGEALAWGTADDDIDLAIPIVVAVPSGSLLGCPIEALGL